MKNFSQNSEIHDDILNIEAVEKLFIQIPGNSDE
jgi:hypothetical protein